MTERIRQTHVMSDCAYGRALVQAELQDMGLCVNHKRIERLMSQAKLRGVSKLGGYVMAMLCRQQTSTGVQKVDADFAYATVITEPATTSNIRIDRVAFLQCKNMVGRRGFETETTASAC